MSKQPSMPLTPQEAMEFMQRMWNPFGMPVPGFVPPGAAGGADAPAGIPFPNPAAMLATLDPAEIDKKIAELRVIENWLAMSQNFMQMSIKTMELQKVSLEAMRAAAATAKASKKKSASKGRRNIDGHHAVLRIGLAVCLARPARARAQGAAVRAQGPFVRCGRYAQARIRGAQSAASRAGAGRRRFRAVRVERDRRIPRRSLSGPRRAAVPGRRQDARDHPAHHPRGRRRLRRGAGPADRRRRSRKSRRNAIRRRSPTPARRWSTSWRCSPAPCAATILPGRCRRRTTRSTRCSLSSGAPELKLPDLDANGMLTPELTRWKARIEALPYFEKTIPPHWRKS